MKLPQIRALGLGCGLAAAALTASPPATAAAPDAPSVATLKGPGSLTGVWVKTTATFGQVVRDEMFAPREYVMTTADGSPLPVLPWAAAIVDQRLKDADAGHPYADTKTRCLPGGTPDMMFGSGPMQILETPGQVTVLRQELTFFWIIRVDGKHPDDPDPTYLGNSVGHWEGDAFVVDSIGITDKTTIKSVIPHTDALHVVERMRRTGPDTLDIEALIDDPKTFSHPWTMVTHLRKLNDTLSEYFCENNRNAPDEHGYTTARGPSGNP